MTIKYYESRNMTKPKEYKVTIRINQEEKKLLELEADRNAMTLSQYVRFISLAKSEESKNNSIEFLNKNISKLTRMFIDGYFCTKAIARNQLTDEEADIVNKNRAKQFQELGIDKKI